MYFYYFKSLLKPTKLSAMSTVFIITVSVQSHSPRHGRHDTHTHFKCTQLDQNTNNRIMTIRERKTFGELWL